ncbi:3-dehydroquinate synthase [Candidatus Entotheonella serta]|nr:3-dehydroquinate synthase [Candidatus Entotheonella serta]
MPMLSNAVAEYISGNMSMSSPHQIAVRTPTENYDIYVGQEVLKPFSQHLAELLPGRKAFIVSHPTLLELYGSTVTDALQQAGFSTETYTIPEGETSKNLQTAAELYTFLAKCGADRRSVLCAFGGGVVGDLTGFAAATYMRGVPFVQIPTTLLAMVDSSIGGKTGVNHKYGKNMIGSFYPPRAVCTDISLLRSLPEREYLCGLSEIVKAGVIDDTELFNLMEREVAAIRQRDEAVLTTLIERAIAVKVRVVEEDPTEQGVRAILNFGHTIGHALEAVTAYEQYSHGEAVAIGMALVARLSETLGLCEPEARNRLYSVLEGLGLPVAYADIDTQRLIDVMAHDKKAIDGVVQFILMRDIGTVVYRQQVPTETLEALLVEYA